METVRGDHTPIGSQGSDEEQHRQVSSSRQGSGITTPHPNGMDKRMPGISQSFLGQVGRFLPSRPSFLRLASSVNHEDVEPVTAQESLKKLAFPRRSSDVQQQDPISYPITPVSSHSPQSPRSRCGSGPILVDRLSLDPNQESEADESWQVLPDQTSSIPYATPPDSKKSSLKLDWSTAEPEPPPAAGINVTALPLLSLFETNSSSHPTAPADHQSGKLIEEASNVLMRDQILSASRKNTASLMQMTGGGDAGRRTQAVTGVDNTSVHARSTPIIQNDHSSTPPSMEPLALSEKPMLTMTAVPPRPKSTPPGSPRMSHSAYTNKHLTNLSHVSNPSSPDSQSRMTSRSGSPEYGIATRTKGKLIVKIIEARGLRPSHDPFVVCSFESADFVSQGPAQQVLPPTPEPDNDSKTTAMPSMANFRPRLIPTRSARQSSQTVQTLTAPQGSGSLMTDPKWNHEAIFDVMHHQSEIEICVYDRTKGDAFLGHLRLCLDLRRESKQLVDGWHKLSSRDASEEAPVGGEIYFQIGYERAPQKHLGPDDFEILKLIGKGTFGQVYQVRKKDTQMIYAMKVLSKKVIIQKKEVAHTVGERNILVRAATTDSPFIINLKMSFQTPEDLYLVTDFMSGGELFWHLQKEGRFAEPRAKFYIAELVLALEHLHKHDIVYRDLKPENILLDAHGHVALCDFGLSKADLTKNTTTNTFCGTTEYLAPEVLLDDKGYTKLVDFWSLGVLVFEMCCGWSPFYAEDTQQMYKNIAFGKVRFPKDALSAEGRNFVKGLLNRNPKHRLGGTRDAQELKDHPFFADIQWDALKSKRIAPPFQPLLKSALDTSNFDPEFTNASLGKNGHHGGPTLISSGITASTPLSPGMQQAFSGFTYVDESTMDEHFGGRDSGPVIDPDGEETESPLTRGPASHMSGVESTGPKKDDLEDILADFEV